MRTLRTVFVRFPWYPLPLGAYPVLALFAYNVSEVRLDVLWRPLAVAAAATLGVFLLLRLALKSWERAALLTALWSILFFSYGHIHLYLAAANIKAPVNVMLAAWLALAGLGLWWAVRTAARLEGLTTAFNVVAFALLLFPLVEIISFSFSQRLANRTGQAHVHAGPLPPAPGPVLPDIYYIILDSYGRADLLKQVYGYDNSGFIQGLEQMGFYVGACSQSNYTRTELSVGSSLNMDYLQNLDSKDFTPQSWDRIPLWEIFKHGAVRSTLEAAGYRTVAFATGFPWSQLDDADVYLEPPSDGRQLTEFEALFLNTTAGQALGDLGLMDLEEISGARFRERTMFEMNSFENLARMPGPKFVFMHVVAPHPPFVFGAAGQAVDPGQFINAQGLYTTTSYAAGYTGELPFLNSEILKGMAALIADSAVPPVIVVQGDHGPWLQPPNLHFRILNAYYLPGHAQALYPSISPVNTFRVILNSYLGGHADLLDDITYDSPVPNIYEFSRVPNACHPNAP